MQGFLSMIILETFLEICNNLKKLAGEQHSLQISKNIKKKLGMS